MTPIIREIEDADVPAVIALWHEAGVARPWNDPATDIAFARRGPHGTVLVAEVDGRIVASAMAGEDGHRGWLYYVAVAPGQQGTGLGRRMVEAGRPGSRRAAYGRCSSWCAGRTRASSASTTTSATATPTRSACRR